MQIRNVEKSIPLGKKQPSWLSCNDNVEHKDFPEGVWTSDN